MTNQVRLTLPTGRELCYRTGQRVRVLSGCPELPDGDPGGEGTIWAFVNGNDVVVRLDGAPSCMLPIPVESRYLEPVEDDAV